MRKKNKIATKHTEKNGNSNPSLSVITLDVNKLNSPIKIHRLGKLIKPKTTRSNYMLSKRDSLQI